MAFNYPYGDTQQLNLNWFLAQWETFREQWATAEEGIDHALDAEIARVEAAMTDLYAARDAAAASKTAAQTAATNAASSETVATQQATLAQSYANTAQTQAGIATAAAEAAGNSASSASNSASNANLSKVQAGNSATAAGQSATLANDKATAAGLSAAQAGVSATNAAGSAEDSEAWAVGERGGSPVASGDDTYENNSKYYADQAATVAASIPADYTELSDDVSKLKTSLSTDDDITWNQLSSAFTRASGSLAGVTYTRSADQKQAVFNGTPTRADFFQIINSGLGTSVVGHKYAFFTPRISGSTSGYWFFYINNRSDARDFGDGVIWTADSATNIVVGIEWSSSRLPTFNNLTVNLPIITDLTACFGAGNEPTIEEFRAMFPNDYYPHDSGTQRKLTQIEKNSLDIYHNTFAVAKTQSSVKIKILTFNCGHYNYGSSSEGSWSGDALTEKINEWKTMLAKYKPDIMFGQEMSNYFDAAQTVNAIDTIFKPLLPNYYFYALTRLLSKYSFIQTWQEDVTVTVGGTSYARSFATAKININGVDIVICSAHLPAGNTATDTSVREAMRDKLITAFANYPYVILGGDFNESTDSFFTPFVTAGYSLGNHGYFGTITTLPNESVDNIIVKGFTFYDAVSDSADACTSDHYPFASEIHIV